MTVSESNRTRWQRLRSEWLHVDLLLVWLFLVVAALVIAVTSTSFVRFLVAVPLVFLVPGYVVVGVLFPHRAGRPHEGNAALPVVDRVGTRERLALSFGLSVALLPLFGLAIGLSPWGLTELVVVRTLVGFTLLVSVVAVVRRRELPPEERFTAPIGQWTDEATRALGSGPVVDRLLNVAVIVCLLLAVGTVGFVLATPQDGEQFTGFAVLTEDENENLVAADYPDELVEGESASLVTAVENHEGESVDYTVVVTVERVSGVGQNATTAEEVELDRYESTVAPGERWTASTEVTPTLVGNDLRLNYYLYRDGAPENPDGEEAYREAHVWIEVGPSG